MARKKWPLASAPTIPVLFRLKDDYPNVFFTITRLCRLYAVPRIGEYVDWPANGGCALEVTWVCHDFSTGIVDVEFETKDHTEDCDPAKIPCEVELWTKDGWNVEVSIIHKERNNA